MFSVASLLNAGANLRLSQPNGSVATLASSGGTGGQYAANLNLYQPGVFTMSGAGGPDVGAFSVPFTVPPALTWSNLDVTSGSVIDRTQPLSIRWTGGDPLGFVDVYVRAGLDNSDVQVIADCAAPVSAGSVSIPASVLLALPAPASLATVTIVGGNSPVFLPVARTGYGRSDRASQQLGSGDRESEVRNQVSKSGRKRAVFSRAACFRHFLISA